MNQSWPANSEYKRAMKAWLKTSFNFTHFVTLAPNKPDLGVSGMLRLLREWDARTNRKMYGPKWHKKQDELLWHFGFLEKPAVNPHWHLLVRVIGPIGADPLKQHKEFRTAAELEWVALTRSGTADIQQVRSNAASTLHDYIAKELGGGIQYERFTTPDEFRYR